MISLFIKIEKKYYHSPIHDCLSGQADMEGKFSKVVYSEVCISGCFKAKGKKSAEHSRAVTDRALWKKKIWTLETPPKVEMFVWRACSNILPRM